MENNNNGMMKKKKEKDGEIIINTGVDKNDVSIEMKNKSKKQQPPSLKSAKSGLKSGLSIPIPERKLSNFGVMHRSTPIQSPYQRSPSVRRQSMRIRGKRRRKNQNNNNNNTNVINYISSKLSTTPVRTLKTPGSALFSKNNLMARRHSTLLDHVPMPQQLQGARKFVPRVLLRKIAANKPWGDNIHDDSDGGQKKQHGPRYETFQAACVFFDISGFSSLASRLQREEQSANEGKTINNKNSNTKSKLLSGASLLTKHFDKSHKIRSKMILKKIPSHDKQIKSLLLEELSEKTETYDDGNNEKDDDLATPLRKSNTQELNDYKINHRSSFSTITTKHTGEGSEKLASAITGFFTSLIEKIHEAGGDIIKFAGDALICLWSADSLEKDKSLGHLVYHAIRCGFGVAKDVVDLEDGSGSLKLHVCVGSGEMSLICLGGVQNRWEFFINGEGYRQSTDGVDLSKPGEIVISDDSFLKLCDVLNIPEGKKRLKIAQKIKDSRYYKMTGLDSALKPAHVKPLPKLDASHINGLLEYAPLCIAHAVHYGTSNAADVRNVTVVFVKFKGLPSIQKDKERALETLHEFFKSVEKAIYSQRGILRQFVVDDKGAVAVIVVGFPPLSYANQAARGVTIALRIRSNSDKFGFSVSAGVTTGTVFCGNVGSAERCEYAAVGHTVNLSARLMSKDKKGQVYVCEDTAKEAASEYRFDSLPKPLILKGCEGPVPVFTPIQRTLPTNLLHCKATKLVGRTKEMEKLMSHVVDSTDFSAVAVFSDSGVGTTTVLVNLMRRLQQISKFKVVGTVGRVAEQQSPYYPFRRVFRSLLGVDSNHVDHFVSCADREKKRSVHEADKNAFKAMDSRRLDAIISYLQTNKKVQPSLWVINLIMPEFAKRCIAVGMDSKLFDRHDDNIDSNDTGDDNGSSTARKIVKECFALSEIFFTLLDFLFDNGKGKKDDDTAGAKEEEDVTRFVILIDDADMLDANTINLLMQICNRQYEKLKIFITALSPKLSLTANGSDHNVASKSISDTLVRDSLDSSNNEVFLPSPMVKDQQLSNRKGGNTRAKKKRFSAIVTESNIAKEEEVVKSVGNGKTDGDELVSLAEQSLSPTAIMMSDEHYPLPMTTTSRNGNNIQSPMTRTKSGNNMTRNTFLKTIASGISLASVTNLFVQEVEQQQRIYTMVDFITQQIDSQITLERLSWENVVVVLKNEAGGTLSSNLLKYIRNASDGELSAAIDVYTTLHDENLIEKIHENDQMLLKLTSAVNSGTVQLPTKMTDLWKRKVDRLDIPSKCVARMISVVGTEVDLEMLMALHALGFSFDDLDGKEQQRSLIDCLKNLVRIGVLVWDASTAVARESTHLLGNDVGESLFYTFTSIAARDGIYNSMTFSDRQKLHRRVMAFYEEAHVDEIELYSSVIAYHAEAAKEYKKAMMCLEDSARYAEFNEDYLDAIVKYGDCIRLAEIDEAASLQFGPSSEVIFINWLCRIAALHLRLGKPGIAHITLEHMLDVLDEDLPTIKTSGGNGGGCFGCCTFDERVQVQEQYELAKQIAEKSGELTRMIGSNTQKQKAAEALAEQLAPAITFYECKMVFDLKKESEQIQANPISFKRQVSVDDDLGQNTAREIKHVGSLFALDTIDEKHDGEELEDHDIHSHNMHLAILDIHAEDDHV